MSALAAPPPRQLLAAAGRRWLLRLAASLGVHDPGRPAEWGLRLLLLPPEARRPLPAPLARALAWLEATAARGLAVPAPGRWRDWCAALLLSRPMPEFRPPLPGTWRPAFLAPAYWLAEPWLHPLLWPLRRLRAALDRLDYRAGSARLEHWAQALESHRHRRLRLWLLALSLPLAFLAISTPLDLPRQFLFLALLWGAAMLVRRMPGDVPTLILVGLSLIASGRYIWWRLSSTLDLEGPLAHVLGYGLVVAEMYTWLILLLGYVQNVWPLKRQPALLPADSRGWPTVDVYIPSYNEPLKVVKPTVLAAANLDWPADKLKIYLLDDGRREEFRAFAAEAGVEYLIRPDNRHAKAGNLNHALTRTQGEYIAIFDCDHIPTRSFLQLTLGWFLRDRRCAMLQTPHHFFSPDPFERNLDTFRRVPNEGSLFYGLVQDGNDLWNAAFFCGSCAVLRRTALEEVGGIAVETVTEDAHTALKMHRRGWTTAYLNLPQAAGLATESLSAHVGQRIRWARGMAQIFRVDNPLFGPGLNLFQRLCYSNAMLHFFHGLPRLVFLTAPLSYLFFEAHVITTSAPMLLAYALPHLMQAGLANSRIQGHYRHSFWAEAYETVLAWYIALPTTLALIAPRIGKFNVTVKGGLVERAYFDWRIAAPFMALALLNIAGLVVGLLRLFWWNPEDAGTVLINLAWTLYNLVMVGTALGVCAEARQVRLTPRIRMWLPAAIRLGDGPSQRCEVRDYSLNGLGLSLDSELPLETGTAITVSLFHRGGQYDFPARVSEWSAPRLGLRFEPLSLRQERDLIECTFGRADAWLQWLPPDTSDRPVASMLEVLHFGLRGFWYFLRNFGHAALVWRRPVTAPGADTAQLQATGGG
ncbi:UDP-forming cellulose synthase catalytic subunit [Stagnimonas aquatica]|uniref:Cellulose synthase catalytic subunit [UDP-forming] n=1 Tax=Stagnimonas aquatica TaxID=2689987 RepID=A0A3N0VLN0_9GAMM|nr:UDP-forming cellulose synthase catalytic subunit [Stagnimonas aquatica]ROH93659.1 UDP-forming cellulose synthase catalytic subunit [Stagnimonas aquatica]